ncbi:MAG: thioesterase family protein [Nocardioidaceae bacterium]
MTRHGYVCHVRFSDVDVYGHVNNVKYFEYYQEARIAFVAATAEREAAAGQRPADDAADRLFAPGSTERQVVARVDVDYRRPLLFRPEPYLVQTWVTRIGGSSYELGCRILDGPADPGEPQDADEAVGPPTVYSTGHVVMVAFDTATQRSRALSATERARLEAALER